MLQKPQNASFGVLRVSEYTTPSPSSYDPNIHLLANNLTLSPQTATLLIKTSKTVGGASTAASSGVPDSIIQSSPSWVDGEATPTNVIFTWTRAFFRGGQL